MATQAVQQPGRGRTTFTWILLGIWLVLISFGAVSAINPPWLQEISSKGIDVEARGAKNAGDTLLRQRAYTRAIPLYQHALEIKPDYVGATVNLAIAYRQIGAVDKAEMLLRDKLKEGEGRQGVIAFNLAELLEKQGKREEAFRYYGQTIGSSVRQDRVLTKLGTLLFEAGEYQRSLDAFMTALDFQTDPAAAYAHMLRRSLSTFEDDAVNLPIIEEQLTRKLSAEELARYDLDIIERRQRADREIATTHTLIGAVHARLNDPRKAITHFESALRIAPENVDAANRLKKQQELLEQQESEAAEPQ